LIVELNGWKIRPLVCYDLRFPVWAKNTYSEGVFEYDCLIYVANWPDARSHHWKTLLLARSIENMSYCVGVNRIGTDGKGTYHGGDSLVIDPKGKLLAAIEKYTEGSATVVLRAEELQRYREKFNVAQDWDGFTVNN
jgi:predicted amidohydrolase